MEDYTAEKKEKKKEKIYKKDHKNITEVFQDKKNIEKEIVRNSEIKKYFRYRQRNNKRIQEKLLL